MLFSSSSNSYPNPFVFEEDLHICSPMNTINTINTHQQCLGNNPSSNGFHQNEAFSDNGSHSNARSFVGQIGLKQRLRSNIYDLGVRPQRLEIRTVIDYLLVQNQTSFSPTDGFYACETPRPVRVTEVIRTHEVVRTTQEMVQTQLLDSVSTRDRFLPPGVNDYSSSWNEFSLQQASFEPHSRTFLSPLLGIQSQTFGFQSRASGFQSQRSSFKNPQACSRGSSHSFPIHGYNYQNPSYNHHHRVNIPDHNLDIPSYNNQTSLQRNISSISFLESDLLAEHEDEDIATMVLEPNPDQNLFQDLIPEVDVQDEQAAKTAVVDDEGDKNTQDDGKTHSLSYKKYGPYTCPLCKSVFITSQTFAAHMRSHYKNESPLQTHMRRKAKYGIYYQPGLSNMARKNKDKASCCGGRKKIRNATALGFLFRKHKQGDVDAGASGGEGLEMEGALIVAPIKDEAQIYQN